MLFSRRTLAGPVAIAGRGLFTARPATLTLLPAAAGAGIVFERTDLPGPPRIPATIDRLSAEPAHPAFARLPARSTSLAADGAGVATTEHILSALAGLGITDAVAQIDGPEVPIMDGSALPFTLAIRDAGVVTHGGPKEPLRLREGVEVSDAGGGRIVAEPSGTAEFVYELDYGPGSPLPAQAARWAGDPEEYLREIAPARTFCLEREARAMRELGLFEHLSASDMLVVGPAGPIDNALRLENEPARHKLLDLIGDLALVGRPVHARIVAARSGHALNHALARRLFAAAATNGG